MMILIPGFPGRTNEGLHVLQAASEAFAGRSMRSPAKNHSRKDFQQRRHRYIDWSSNLTYWKVGMVSTSLQRSQHWFFMAKLGFARFLPQL